MNLTNNNQQLIKIYKYIQN